MNTSGEVNQCAPCPSVEAITVAIGVYLFSYQDPVSVQQLTIPMAAIVAIKTSNGPPWTTCHAPK